MKFVKFKVGDLFDIHPTKAYKGNNSILFSIDGKTPVVANNSVNNGIGGYSNLEPTEKGGIITFSDTTTPDAIFFQPEDFIGYAHVQGMYPKSNEWNNYSMKYFMVLFKKCAKSIGFDYANKFNRAIASDFIIDLPSLDGVHINFEYMDNYIQNIESNCVNKVNNFIENVVTANSELSKIDEDIFKDNVLFGEFQFDEILEKINVKKLPYKVKSLPSEKREEYILPALTAGINNQGLSCYVPYNNATILKNCISVSANGANTGAMFYQPYEFTVLQDSYALKTIEEKVSGFAQIYLVGAMQHRIKGNYDWTNKAGWERIRKHKMMLPIDSNKRPDYDYMDKYIRYQEKLLIDKYLN